MQPFCPSPHLALLHHTSVTYSTLKCCHTPALTQPQPSHIQTLLLGFLPAPGHQLHLQLCWEAPSITSSSSPRSHCHHGTHPDKDWPPAEASPRVGQHWRGEAVGAGPAQHLSMPEVRPAPFATAAPHSCTAPEHPQNPPSSRVLFCLLSVGAGAPTSITCKSLRALPDAQGPPDA